MCYYCIFYFVRLAGMCIYSKIRAFLPFGGNIYGLRGTAIFRGGSRFYTGIGIW